MFVDAGQKDWIPSNLETKNRLKQTYNEPMVVIQTNDQKQVRVPTSLVQMMGTLTSLQQEVGGQGEIPLQQISSSQLLPALALIESAHNHRQLRGQKLIDAMGKDVYIKDGIEVLKAVNYLDVKPTIDKPVIEFLAHELALAQDSPWWKPRRNIPLNQQLRDFGPDAAKNYGALIARYYVLLTGKNLPNLPQEILTHKNYAFSIKEYVEHPAAHDFLREKFGNNAFGYFPTRSDRWMPMGGPDSLSQDSDGVRSKNSNGDLNLSELNINDIEGLSEYWRYMHPAFQWRVATIHLDHNKIESLTKANSFRALASMYPRDNNIPGVYALVLSDNKIVEINPVVFNDLPDLRVVDLRNNPLSEENKQRLRAAHPNKLFRF